MGIKSGDRRWAWELMFVPIFAPGASSKWITTVHGRSCIPGTCFLVTILNRTTTPSAKKWTNSFVISGWTTVLTSRTTSSSFCSSVTPYCTASMLRPHHYSTSSSSGRSVNPQHFDSFRAEIVQVNKKAIVRSSIVSFIDWRETRVVDAELSCFVNLASTSTSEPICLATISTVSYSRRSPCVALIQRRNNIHCVFSDESARHGEVPHTLPLLRLSHVRNQSHLSVWLSHLLNL